MEPPREFWDTALKFLKFLPYFIGLLVLGVIKGDMLLKSLASFWCYILFSDEQLSTIVFLSGALS
jgi:hypothetical protein